MGLSLKKKSPVQGWSNVRASYAIDLTHARDCYLKLACGVGIPARLFADLAQATDDV